MRVVKYWNRLPSSVATAPSVIVFKKRLEKVWTEVCNPVFGRGVNMSLHTKNRLYQAVVRSIPLYGCETWPVRVDIASPAPDLQIL